MGENANIRCIGGKYDGHEGTWAPGFEGEEYFPDVLWIGSCKVPDCPCEGKELAASPYKRDADSVRYFLHGMEEHLSGFKVAVYRDSDVSDVELSRMELAAAGLT